MADNEQVKDALDVEENPADKIYAEDEEKPESEKKPEDESDDAVDDDAEKSEGDDDPEGDDKPDDDPEESEKDDDSDKKGAPEKYEFETNEDSPVTDEHLQEIAEYAKARGMTQEDAQKLVDMQEKALEGFKNEQQQMLKDKSEEWAQESRSDKEIGGEAFNENVENAKRLITKFGDEGIKDFLNTSGLGNNPSVIRLFTRLSKAVDLSEDKLELGEQKSKAKPVEDLFYGEETKN